MFAAFGRHDLRESFDPTTLMSIAARPFGSRRDAL
jgi:hypothetical protein